MYGIYANIGGILMVYVTIYSIHGILWVLDPRICFEKSRRDPGEHLRNNYFFGTKHDI